MCVRACMHALRTVSLDKIFRCTLIIILTNVTIIIINLILLLSLTLLLSSSAYSRPLDGLLRFLVAQLLQGVVVVALAFRQKCIQVAAFILDNKQGSINSVNHSSCFPI